MPRGHNLKLAQPATKENLAKSFPQYIVLTPWNLFRPLIQCEFAQKKKKLYKRKKFIYIIIFILTYPNLRIRRNCIQQK